MDCYHCLSGSLFKYFPIVSCFQILEEYEINLGAEADEERKRTRQLIARLNGADKN